MIQKKILQMNTKLRSEMFTMSRYIASSLMYESVYLRFLLAGLSGIILSACEIINFGASNHSASIHEAKLRPSKEVAEEIELTVKLPSQAQPLGHYIRYYAFAHSRSRDTIKAIFHYEGLNSVGRREFVDERRLPWISDGECDVIRLEYKIPTKTFVSIECNGIG